MDTDDIDRNVQAAQGGDREAFHRLVIALQRDVRLFIAAHAYRLDLVEEALQDTFVTAFEQLARYEPRGTFVSWLKGVARNVMRHEFRDRRRSAALHAHDFESAIADLATEDLDDSRPEENLLKLRDCLDQLPKQSRTLLERRYAQGISLSTLAQHFKRSIDNLSLTLHRLRKNVRECLSGKGIEW